MEKQTAAYSYNRILFGNKNSQIKCIYWMHLTSLQDEKKKADIEKTILFAFINKEVLKQTKLI